MYEDTRYGGRREAGDTSNLCKVLRPRPLKALDHLIRKAPDYLKLKAIGDAQSIVVINP